MSNFAFPPPPPPPPKAAGVPETSNYGLPQRGRGRGRGDRGSRDNSRGGGRGRDFSAGHVGVDGSRGNRSFSNLRGPRVSNDTYSSHDRFAPDGAFRGQKRKRDDFQRVPKPQAAPAVPSFGGPLLPGPANVATKPTLSDSSQGDVPRTALSKVKANALGLTPYGDSSDDEVEDDDEAAMAAAAAASSGR